MTRALGLVAAATVGLLPISLWPERWIVAAALLAMLVSAAGVLRPSPGLARAGSLLGMLVFAAALITVPPAGAMPAALLMGIAILCLLDLAALRAYSAESDIEPGALQAHLARLGLCIMLAAFLLPLLAAPARALPLQWSGMFRPLLAVAGGLIAFAGAVRAFYTTSSIRNGPRRASE